MATLEEIHGFIDQYCAKGWNLFPIVPGASNPATHNGFHAAHTDVEKLKKIYMKRYNIGLATGKVSGVIVIDFDMKEAEAWQLAEDWGFPATPVVRTPRGGLHFYFKCPDDGFPCTQSAIYKGVDTRGDGGYVVAPPSTRAGGRCYEWADCEEEELAGLPQSVFDMMKAYRERPIRAADGTLIATDTDGAITLASGAVGANQTLVTMAMSMRSLGFTESMMRGAMIAAMPNIIPSSDRVVEEKEVERIIKSAMTKSVGAHTLARQIVKDSIEVVFDGEGDQPTAKPKTKTKYMDSELTFEDKNPGGLIGMLKDSMLKHSNRKQPDLYLAAAICAMGSLIAGKIVSDKGGWPSVFMLGVAESGFGKDTPRKSLNKYFKAAEFDNMGAGDFGSDSGFVEDVKSKPNGLIIIDEVAHFFSSLKGNNVASHLSSLPSTIMKMFSATGNCFQGKALKDRNKVINIESPCINIFGMTTQGKLHAVMSSAEVLDGFLSRFLYIRGTKTLPRISHDASNELDSNIVDAIRFWRNEMPLNGPVKLTHTDDAELLMRDLAEHFDERWDEETNPISKVFWTRAYEKVMRLAPIYAASRDPDVTEITVEDVNRAGRLVEKMTMQFIEDVANNVSDSIEQRDKKDILNILIDLGPMSVQMLSRKTSYMSSRRRKEVLQDLINCGTVRYAQVESNGKMVNGLEATGTTL